MKKEDVLKYIETKGDASFVIRTEEEETQFLANKVKEVEEKTIPDKIRELHSQYDEDVFSVVGLRKNPTEKTYDFVKRVLGSLKTDAQKAVELQGEIEKLKKQIADGAGDKQIVADLEAVKKAYKDLEETKNSEITKLQTQHERFKAESQIRAALPTKFKKGLPEEAVQALVNQAVNHLLGMAKFEGDKLQFIENGVVKRNPHKALDPYTAQDLLNETLKNIIDTAGPDKGKGPDINNEVTYEKDDKGKISKVIMVIPESVKYKEDLSEFLVKTGLLRGTAEYNAAYAQYSPSFQFRPR